MEISALRALIHQLSEDFNWLESYCHLQATKASKDQQAAQSDQLSAQAAQLRLAASLVRNTVGPYLEDQCVKPLHVTVVGGASAGKSTVVNMLTGSAGAEATAQAGFTRHPIAYIDSSAEAEQPFPPSYRDFLGPLRYLKTPTPANLDEDVYQVRRLPADPHFRFLLKDFIVWDCPDMTTYAAAGYYTRLLEICGLTDVLVYVASDERYNDMVPTRFLELLLQAGKPVVCVLTKVRKQEADSLLAHFKETVLSKMAGAAISCLSVPFQKIEELNRKDNQYRLSLLNQVAVIGRDPAQLRTHSVKVGTSYLLSHCDHMLAVARNDLNALQNWRGAVQVGHTEFDTRYRQEYLQSEKFTRFDEALVRLLELLELPGVGQYLSNVMWVIRMPYRLLRGWISKSMARPDAPTSPERPILEAALTGWLDYLRKEAVSQSNTHPVWKHVEQGFATGGLADQAREKFETGFRGFQTAITDEVERTARSIYEDLEKNPFLLNTLRGGKLGIDVMSIIGGLFLGGTHFIADLVLVPLAASVSQHLVELLGARYVDAQREQTRDRQQALVTQQISGPLAEFLIQWPATGGSSFESLQRAIKQIPPGLKQLDESVRAIIK
jgi:GTP-binding protein EngB required for normal cell division